MAGYSTEHKPQPSREEAEAHARSALELVTSYAAPLLWVIRDPDGLFRTRNGTVFFVDAGNGPIAVTAAHVIEGWRKDRSDGDVGPLQISGEGTGIWLRDIDQRLIDADCAIDIASFAISASEVKTVGKKVLGGYHKNWPPPPPDAGSTIVYSGYPGDATQLALPSVTFGIACGLGVAGSVSEVDICIQIQREYLRPVHDIGGGIPPENYEFGGISGGPVLSIIETPTRVWSLAGVMYQGPNTSKDPQEAIAGLEIIRARRSRFLLPDGRLDRALWDGLRL
jgi:hypothetical protein